VSQETRRQKQACAICRKLFAPGDLVPAAVLRQTVVDEIRRQHPEWTPDGFICKGDLAVFRGRYVHSLLESEKGEVTSLEQDVIRSLREHELLSQNIEASLERHWTLGERLADRLAAFGGSWWFLIVFGICMALWITLNSLVMLYRPIDPYPFILLNLLLSCLAAIQAPVIMMSQNRQEAKDRQRAQHDYKINLKAELEIRHLHEKMDHLLSHQWERLVEIQEIQLELLAEIGRRK